MNEQQARLQNVSVEKNDFLADSHYGFNAFYHMGCHHFANIIRRKPEQLKLIVFSSVLAWTQLALIEFLMYTQFKTNLQERHFGTAGLANHDYNNFLPGNKQCFWVLHEVLDKLYTENN